MARSLCMDAQMLILFGIASQRAVKHVLSCMQSDRGVLGVAMTGVGSPQERQQHQKEEGSASGEERNWLSKASSVLAGHQYA